MKTIVLLLAVLLLAVTPSLRAADHRVVNGIHVDLTPIQDWKATKAGPRPMPHWKDVTVVEHRGLFGPGHRVVLQIDGVGQQEVVLQFPPVEFLELLRDEQAARNRAAYAGQVAAAAKQAERAWDTEAARRIDPAYSTASFAQALATRRAAGNTAAEAGAAAAEQRSFANNLAAVRMSYRDLAMCTGRSVGPLQIWTFGQKASR